MSEEGASLGAAKDFGKGTKPPVPGGSGEGEWSWAEIRALPGLYLGASLAGLFLALFSASLHVRSVLDGAGRSGPLVRAESRLILSATGAVNAMRDFAQALNPASLGEYESQAAAFWQASGDIMVAAARIPGGPEGIRESLDAVSGAFRLWQQKFAEPVKALNVKSAAKRLPVLEADSLRRHRIKELVASEALLHAGIGRLLGAQDAGSGFREFLGLAGVLLGLAGFLAAGAAAAVLHRRRMLWLVLRSRHLEELADYSERIQFMTSADQAAALASEQVIEKVGATGALALMRREDEKGLRVAACAGPGDYGSRPSPVLTDPNHCPVMRTGQPFVIKDVSRGPVCDCPLGVPSRGTYACLPLLAQGRINGLLNVKKEAGEDFRPGELEHVERLTRSTSIALNGLFGLQAAHKEATVDPLTGVFNRRFLDPFLEKQVQSSVRSRQPLAVLLMDLDGFKKINDNHSHLVGDRVLRSFADAAQTCVRAGDLVGRFGGDEFIVILPHSGRVTASEIAERLRKAARDLPVPASSDGERPYPGVSIGIACVPEDGATSAEILEKVDSALYRSKRRGGDWITHASEMPAAAGL